MKVQSKIERDIAYKLKSIKIMVTPILNEKDFAETKKWQRKCMGAHISEFYTEVNGHIWTIYFKKTPLLFKNCADKLIQEFIEHNIYLNGKLNVYSK